MTEVLTREKKAAWTAWRSAYKSGTGRKILRQAGRILLGAAPGFALAFSDICGVSAGAWAAYGIVVRAGDVPGVTGHRGGVFDADALGTDDALGAAHRRGAGAALTACA